MKTLNEYIDVRLDEDVKIGGVGIGLVLRNQKEVDECRQQTDLHRQRIESIRDFDGWKKYAAMLLVQSCEAWNQLLKLGKADKNVRTDDLEESIKDLFYWTWTRLEDTTVGSASLSDIVLRDKSKYEGFIKYSKPILSAYKNLVARKPIKISI